VTTVEYHIRENYCSVRCLEFVGNGGIDRK